MKSIFKLLVFLFSSFFADAEEEADSVKAKPLAPLIEVIDKGGLVGLNSYLENGNNWPRITTDSFAVKNNISNYSELVALAKRVVRNLREQAEVEFSSDIISLEAEADLFFGLGQAFEKAGGFTNRALALLCCQLASHRCGKIAILSRGEKLGPRLPAMFKASTSQELLASFVSMIPEHPSLSESGLYEKLVDEPVAGATWLEMLDALRNLDLDGATVAQRHGHDVGLLFEAPGAMVFRANVSGMVLQQARTQTLHDSVLPALGMYLKNGGLIEVLLRDPTNAVKFREVMKEGASSFSIGASGLGSSGWKSSRGFY